MSDLLDLSDQSDKNDETTMDKKMPRRSGGQFSAGPAGRSADRAQGDVRFAVEFRVTAKSTGEGSGDITLSAT